MLGAEKVKGVTLWVKHRPLTFDPAVFAYIEEFQRDEAAPAHAADRAVSHAPTQTSPLKSLVAGLAGFACLVQLWIVDIEQVRRRDIFVDRHESAGTLDEAVVALRHRNARDRAADACSSSHSRGAPTSWS